MPEAVIVDGVRTPFVKATGALSHTPAQELGRLVVRELLYRTNLAPDEVDELICGNVASPLEAANVARVIALRAGIPKDRVAHTVNRNCASGMESLTQAVDRVRAGHAKCVVADGRTVFVSSANFTEAAQDRNIELGLLIHSSALAGRITAHFDAMLAQGFLSGV